MIRRQLWLCVCAFGLASTVLAAERPNVLVIISDEHTAAITGCYGNPIVRTPNLDRLAARGVTFDAAYTASPLCVPARLSFTSGKYISHVGAWSNSCRLPSEDYPSLPRIMADAGYDSYLCGKMHYDRNRRYGFTEIGDAFTNQSHKTGRGGRRPPDKLNNDRLSGRFKQFYPAEQSRVLDHDRQVTAGVVDFLVNRKKTDKPFFLVAGYLAPHFPLIVPEEYWQHYKGKVPMPVIPEGFLDTMPRNYKHLRAGFEMTDVPPDTVRKGRELYYGLTEWVDTEIGKVLTTLDKTPLGEDTVIVYTTDHGENLGEHGLWWKNCLFEHGARVPLIVSWPQRWEGGQRRSGACSYVDLVRTIAEIGRAKVPADWDGDSMVEYLDDANVKWKDYAVSEYYGHNIASGMVMLRQGRYKYIYHTPADADHPAQRELYDLEADPGEFRNLASDPAQSARIQRMHALLVRELGEDPDQTELRCRSDYARGYAAKKQ